MAPEGMKQWGKSSEITIHGWILTQRLECLKWLVYHSLLWDLLTWAVGCPMFPLLLMAIFSCIHYWMTNMVAYLKIRALVGLCSDLSLVFCFPQEFFENPAFRPDGMKLYPTLVIRGTGLYELWKSGRYKSYPPSTLVDLVARILALVPPWTRVYRVQR